jgi:hypothetical protein
MMVDQPISARRNVGKPDDRVPVSAIRTLAHP